MSASLAPDPLPADRPYRGVPLAERQAQRRERLLDAGLELYGTVGFANVGIQTLCKQSGVTARHFYEAFDSQAEVLEAVHDRIVAEVSAAVLASVSEVPPDDPNAMSRTGLLAFYGSMLGDPRRAQIATVEVMGLPREKALACVDEFVAIIEFYAQALSDAGVIHIESVHLDSVMLAGAVRQLMIDWLTTRTPSIEKLADVTAELFAKVGNFVEP